MDRKGRSTRMRAWVAALAVAAPVEFLLFCEFAYPVDAGFTASAGWVSRRVCDLWLVVHWPILKALPWMERHRWSAGSEMLAFFGWGYLTLAVLLLAAILGWQAVRRKGKTAKFADEVTGRA